MTTKLRTLSWLLILTSLAACQTQDQITKTFEETVEDGKRQAVVAAAESLSADAKPFEPTQGVFENEHPAWFRQGRLILTHSVEPNVYRIPDANGHRLVTVASNHHQSVPRIVFQTKSDALVWLNPIDNETQHLTVTDLEANWHEAYIITKSGVRPFGAEAYLSEIAQLEGFGAFFDSLQKDLAE